MPSIAPCAAIGLGHVIGLTIVRGLKAEAQLLLGSINLVLEFMRDLALLPDLAWVD